MTTIEDKLNLFSKIVYDKIQKDKDAEVENLKKEMDERINREQILLDEKKKKAIDEVNKNVRLKASEIIAREKLKMQKDILALKKQIVSETIDEVEKLLVKFVNTSSYKDYLLNQILTTINNLDEKSCTLYLTKGDLDKFKNQIEDTIKYKSIEIRSIDADIIGGIIMEDSQGKFRIDNSLKTKLSNFKEYAGLKITELIEQEVSVWKSKKEV